MFSSIKRYWKKAIAFYDSMLGRYQTVLVAELPDRLAARTIYAVGDSGQYWLAAMRCPCECGDIIQLAMLHGQRPRWSLSDRNLRFPTLTPSVDRTVRCRSHFFLRNGRISWCN